MLTQAPSRYARAVRIAARLGVVVITLLVAALISGWLAVRFWLWPSMPTRQAELLATVQTELQGRNMSLTMGELVADWESWASPRLRLRNVEIKQADGQAVLAAGQIEAVLGVRSLMSLWHWRPIFSEIRLTDVFVSAQRLASGEIEVAGFNVSAQPSDGVFMDWLFRQGRTRLDRGELLWRDAIRDRWVRVTDVTLAMNNFSYRHSWALRAALPEKLGEGFVLQGRFYHDVFGRPSNIMDWQGEAFVQFDRVNLAELFKLVHLPASAPLRMDSGQGAMRAWLALDNGELKDLTADVDLSDASLAWGSARARPISVQHLAGRMIAKASQRTQELRLSKVSLRSAQLQEPMAIGEALIRIDQPPDSADRLVDITMDAVDVQSAAWLANYFPLPSGWKSALDAYAPRGKLANAHFGWRESGDAVTGFSADTRFDGLTIAAGKTRPGFAGLAGSVKAKEGGGELIIDGRNASLIFPGIFDDPSIALDRIEAQFSWVSKNILDAQGASRPDVAVTVKKLSASNPDVALEAAGSYQWAGSGAGRAALDGRVLRADPRRIYRYVPRVAGKDTIEWLKDALLAAKSYSAKFELHGPLDAFPFRDQPSSRFTVKAEVDDASLRPAPGWPVISGIHANVEFDRQRFRIQAKSGAKLNELQLSEIIGRIDDLEADHPVLAIGGSLSGDFQKLIAATNNSPLRRMFGGATSEMKGKGNVDLSLAMKLDLADSNRSLVDGKLALTRGVFQPSSMIPEASIASADIEFDQSALRMIDVRGQALGGQLNVSGKVPKGSSGVSLSAEGIATGQGIEKWVADALGVSLEGGVTGSTRYVAEVESKGDALKVKVASPLEGLGIEVFGPIHKLAQENWNMRLEMNQASSTVANRAVVQSWVIASNQKKLSGSITRIVSSRGQSTTEVETPQLAGQFRWIPAQPASDKAKGGRRAALLQAKLSRLWLESPDSKGSNSAARESDKIAQDWPTVDIAVDDFRIDGTALGKLELQASPVAASKSWEILRLAISNPDAELSGQGQWLMLSSSGRGPVRSRTAMTLDVEVKNGGALLGRFGYVGLVKGTKGKISGKLNWPGSPTHFSGAVLSGNLSMNLERGQFSKMEPGIARLLGILSLQFLPRRIQLDFRDVFSEGFAFEKIAGDLDLVSGKVATKNLRVIGPQASVLLEGTTDISAETQDLRILVLPEFTADLAALGYAALVNPAVGLGAFIAQYILKNPVKDLLSYEYHVTGTWKDPVVNQVRRDLRKENAQGPSATEKK